jgi:hypothetical protein
MIKHVSKRLKEKGGTGNEEIADAAKFAIARNFGGKLNASDQMGQIFSRMQGIEDIYN